MSSLYTLIVTNDIRPFLQSDPTKASTATYGNKPYGVTFNPSTTQSVTNGPSNVFFSPLVFVQALAAIEREGGQNTTLPGGASGTCALLSDQGYFDISVYSNHSGPNYSVVTDSKGGDTNIPSAVVNITVQQLLASPSGTFTIFVQDLPYYTVIVNLDDVTISVTVQVYTVAEQLTDLFNPATLGAIYNGTDALFVPGAVFQINTMNNYTQEFLRAGTIVYASDSSTLDTSTYDDKLKSLDSFFTFEVFTDKNGAEFLMLRNLQYGYATWSKTNIAYNFTNSLGFYVGDWPNNFKNPTGPYTYDAIVFDNTKNHSTAQTAINNSSDITGGYLKWTVVTATESDPMLGNKWWQAPGCASNSTWEQFNDLSHMFTSPGPAPPPRTVTTSYHLLCNHLNDIRILTSGTINPSVVVFWSALGRSDAQTSGMAPVLCPKSSMVPASTSSFLSSTVPVPYASKNPVIGLDPVEASASLDNVPYMITASAGTVLAQSVLPYGTKFSTPSERVVWIGNLNSEEYAMSVQYVSQRVNTNFYFTLLNPGLQLMTGSTEQRDGLMYQPTYAADCYGVSSLNGTPIVLFNSSAGATTCPQWSMLGYPTVTTPTLAPCDGRPGGGPSVGRSKTCKFWPSGENSFIQQNREDAAKNFITQYCGVAYTNGNDGISCKKLLDQPSAKCSGFRTDNYADACKFACVENPSACLTAQQDFCDRTKNNDALDYNDCACQLIDSSFKNTYTDMPSSHGVTLAEYTTNATFTGDAQSVFPQCWWHPCIVDPYTALSKNVPYGVLSGSYGGCPQDLLLCTNVLQGGDIVNSTGVEIDLYNKCALNSIQLPSKAPTPAAAPSQGAFNSSSHLQPADPPLCMPGSSSCCIPGSPSCCSSGSCPARPAKKLSTWAMIGIVAGVFVFFMAVIIGSYKIYMNKKAKAALK
jgi:hypothetical protein